MPPKGKPLTKGQKQIVEENKKTLQFYQYILLGVNGVYWLLQYWLFWDSFTLFYMFLGVSAVLACLGSYKFMQSMAQAKYTPEGALIDGGLDLNMESGMSEHAKDLILFTSIVQSVSLLSNYFWLLWLLVPGRAFYMLWVNILAPWIFAPPPEVDEKKTKKMERKMRRH
ncbi:transmembrane protein 208-like [Pecten maximus]|uniref:transmembrane protein 208-like n=1 Tax=Pecten maximus TaxID=6579 RepID=UPI00145875A8|nr:transmembrane protein 208-like [Pecten maximus]